MIKKLRTLVLIVALVLTCIIAGWGQKHQKSEAQTVYENQRDVLQKYTIPQLYEVLSKRTDKTVYDDQPRDLKDIPSAQIADDIIGREKTIYGPDRRKDYFEIQDPDILRVANSVAAIIPTQYLAASSNGYQISKGCPSLGGKYNLCSKESYRNQPIPSVCTAFVVDSDVIATAGHCVPWLGTSRVVFTFREEGTAKHAEVHPIAASQIYRPMQVLAQKYDKAGADFALVRVDRPIVDHPPLQLHKDGNVAKGTIVYVLGHPSGLPLKLADSALVGNVVSNGYFVSNLDTFGGNSGSPVFNAGNNVVEGILARGGETDYRQQGICSIAFICPIQPDGTKNCSGEASTLISELANSLKEIASGQPKSASGKPKSAANLETIQRTYRSGPKPSGIGAAFSPEYELVSDAPPPGYKIGNYTYSLTGDRGCNAWSICKVSVIGDRVVLRFSLQGHNEWFPPRPAFSEGVITVTYVPAT